VPMVVGELLRARLDPVDGAGCGRGITRPTTDWWIARQPELCRAVVAMGVRGPRRRWARALVRWVRMCVHSCRLQLLVNRLLERSPLLGLQQRLHPILFIDKGVIVLNLLEEVVNWPLLHLLF